MNQNNTRIETFQLINYIAILRQTDMKQ